MFFLVFFPYSASYIFFYPGSCAAQTKLHFKWQSEMSLLLLLSLSTVWCSLMLLFSFSDKNPGQALTYPSIRSRVTEPTTFVVMVWLGIARLAGWMADWLTYYALPSRIVMAINLKIWLKYGNCGNFSISLQSFYIMVKLTQRNVTYVFLSSIVKWKKGRLFMVVVSCCCCCLYVIVDNFYQFYEVFLWWWQWWLLGNYVNLINMHMKTLYQQQQCATTKLECSRKLS